MGDITAWWKFLYGSFTTEGRLLSAWDAKNSNSSWTILFALPHHQSLPPGSCCCCLRLDTFVYPANQFLRFVIDSAREQYLRTLTVLRIMLKSILASFTIHLFFLYVYEDTLLKIYIWYLITKISIRHE